MKTRTTLRFSLFVTAAIGAALGRGAVAGQEPAATFRSAVDVVRVDIGVLDRDGRPIEGLAARDFQLSIDGKPRRLVTADYVGASVPPEKAPPRSPFYSTNAGSAGGRLIVFVVDQSTIGAGRARQTTNAAERFVAKLSPSDRVALVTLPGSPQAEFTANHAMIRAQLQRLVGTAAPAIAVRELGMSESVAISRGDERAINAALTRECRGAMSPLERRMCRQEVLTNASILYSETRDRSMNLLSTLRTLLQSLAEMPEPKTLILISGGLVVEQDYSQLSWFGPLVSRAQATVYSMLVLGPHFEASLQRLPVQYREDATLSEEGLSQVAHLGRGSLFRITTDPEPLFDRIAAEISGYYLLGFEAEAADRDERPHKIKVEVPDRDGVDVRVRPEFSAASSGARTLEGVVVETIRAPLIANEIRLKVTTYTFRELDTQKLRIVVGAEIDRVRETAGRLAVGFGLYDARGQVVASQVEPDVSTRINPRTGTHQYFTAARVDAAGTYRVKVAVVDDLRRRGSVEHTFTAQLNDVGPLRGGDLLLAEVGGQSSGDAEPVISGEFTSDAIHALMDLYADGPDALKDAAVTFEISDGEKGPAITSVPGVPARNAPDGGSLRSLQAALPISLLPTGDYVARAVITTGGKKVGQIARPFRVSHAVIASGRMPQMLPSRLDSFDRRAVLAGDVVGFFLDRMQARNARTDAGVVAHAREGRFDDLLTALKSSGSDDLSVAFLGGLALYARGEMNAAMGRFREALKVDSEFFPAAFYLGACYAAGGRDREAANAWQTSLVTESDAPFIYPLIADAMLRARDTKGAVEILREAAGRWPDNEHLQARLGIAYALAGKIADAIQTLDPYLSRHPDDHEKLFVVLRAIYQARSAGASVESLEKDRAMFARYAEAYAAAGGPQQALVARWKKFLEGK